MSLSHKSFVLLNGPTLLYCYIDNLYQTIIVSFVLACAFFILLIQFLDLIFAPNLSTIGQNLPLQ